MWECRSSRNKDSPHERVFVVVPVQSSWVVHLTRFLPFFNVKFTLCDDRPACLWNNPKRCYAIVVREVIARRHVFTQIDLDIRIISMLALDLLVQWKKV